MSRHRTIKSTGNNGTALGSGVEDVVDMEVTTPRTSSGMRSTASQSRSGRSRRMTAPEGAGDDLFLAMANDESAAADNASSSGPLNARTTIKYKTERPSLVKRYGSMSYTPSPLANPHYSTAEADTNAESSPLYPSAVEAFRHRPSQRNASQTSLASHSSRRNTPYKPSDPFPQYSATRHIQDAKPPKIESAPNSRDRSTPTSKLVFAQYKAGQDAAYRRSGGARSYSQSFADGTESMVSTTATSTVWEDLDELKSRIRRIESSGGRRNSSVRGLPLNGVTSAADRPRTATTTNTASTTSNQRFFSPPSSRDTHATTSSTHPLLHSALAKVKLVLEPSIYQALEASANDAVELSNGLSFNSSASFETSSSKTGSGFGEDDFSKEKRLRRKAENLCRSITELCIAMCEDTSQYQPSSPLLRSKLATRRKTSLDHSAAGAYSSSPTTYLEARRARVERAEGNYMHSNPLVERNRYHYTERQRASTPPTETNAAQTDDDSHSTGDHTTPRTLNRATTSFEQNKIFNAAAATAASASYNQRLHEESDQDYDHTIRIPSRSVSEIQRPRSHSKHQELSRQYTQRHPMPPVLDRSNADAIHPSTIKQASQYEQERQQARISARNESNVSLNSTTRFPISRGISSILNYNSQRWQPSQSISRRSGSVDPDGEVTSSKSHTSASSKSVTDGIDDRMQPRGQQKVASAGQLGHIQFRNTAANPAAASG